MLIKTTRRTQTILLIFFSGFSVLFLNAGCASSPTPVIRFPDDIECQGTVSISEITAKFQRVLRIGGTQRPGKLTVKVCVKCNDDPLVGIQPELDLSDEGKEILNGLIAQPPNPTFPLKFDDKTDPQGCTTLTLTTTRNTRANNVIGTDLTVRVVDKDGNEIDTEEVEIEEQE